MKSLLRTLMLQLIRIGGAPSAYMASRQARKQAPEQPRILLVRPDHLGDMVMTTPVLQALRTQLPQAHITMMAGPWSSEIVERHPAIDQLITCPFPGFRRASQKPLAPYTLLIETARQVRRGNYDLAINLRPDFWWGAALLYLAGIPRRVGYAISPGTPFLTHALPFPQPEHSTVSNLRLISAGLQTLNSSPLEEPYTPECYPQQFAVTAEERQWVTKRLQNAGIATTTPIIVIHPGTGAAVKLWRTEAWSHCTQQLMETTSPASVHVVLSGSPSERPQLEEIAKDITPSPLLITDMSVGQLAALLQRARLVLGVDNGPLHLAVAQNTPTINIFGPTDARIFGPWGAAQRHIVIASTQRCPGCPAIPCGRLDFRPEELAEHPCVRLVPEKRVEEAIATLMEVAHQ
jgi:ADP-heptose:LPS heptosyltransferase